MFGVAPPGFGYAFNTDVTAVDYEKPHPGDQNVPLIYDSTNLARNAADKVASLPHPGRHNGKNIISFLDGHTKAVAPD